MVCYNLACQCLCFAALYDEFETCAQSVATLYRQPHSWRAFQSAATATTQFFKAATDGHRRAYETGVANGRQRLIKELLGVLMTSPQTLLHAGRVYMRRDELLAVLAQHRPTPIAANHRYASGSNGQQP